MEFEALTEKIIGCAFRVHNTMGCGFVERVYEKCLMIELGKAGLAAAAQEPISVRYEGESVGEFVADIVVEDTVILELKSVKAIAEAHEVQLVNYLTAPASPSACFSTSARRSSRSSGRSGASTSDLMGYNPLNLRRPANVEIDEIEERVGVERERAPHGGDLSLTGSTG